MDFTVGIVSRNIATASNFVEFRDSRNFTFFEARIGVQDTWHLMSGPKGATCQAMEESSIELKWGSHVTHGIIPFEGNLS